MKLLMIMSATDVGGAQRFCLNICKYFNSIGYDYQVLFLRKGKSAELKQEFIDNHICFLEFDCKSVMRSIPQIVRYVNKMKPDVMLSTVGNVDFAVAVAKLFIPRVKFYIRKANVVFDNQKSGTNIAKLRFEAFVCDKLIALTKDMKQDYLQYGFKEKNIVVINNMVDLEYINRRLKEAEPEHEWFDKTKYHLIVANARMVPEKRHDVLIKAFEIVEKAIPESRLMILGNGPLRKQIEEMVPQSLKDKIAFMGFQNNPYYYMYHASVFALTSDYEGFPNVVIEALACGLPVVTTNCKTGPREIIENGKDGYVVERGDYNAMADALVEVLSNEGKRTYLSQNAINKAKQYNVAKIAKDYISILN